MDIKDVESLANLARIELSEQEKKELLSDMDSILSYVKAVESVNVEGADSEYDMYNVWREDQIIPQEFSRDLIIQQFPAAQDNFLKVKKIL